MNPRLALVFALLVSVPLVGNSFVLALPADPPEYRHSIEPVREATVPEDVRIYRYGSLSSEARDAIDAALAAPNGDATVAGEANRPPEFHYSDHVAWGSGWYVVERGGTRYRLTTYAGGSIDVRPIQRGLFTLLGLVVALVGLTGYRVDAEYVPAVVAGVAVLPPLPILAGSYPAADAAVMFGTVGALGVGFVALGAHVPARVAATCAVVGAGVGLGLAAFTGFGSVPVLFIALLGLSIGTGALLARTW